MNGATTPSAALAADAAAKPPRLLLTSRDGARALSISERTLWGLSEPRGPIPVVKVGRSVRYAVADLEAWVDAQRERKSVKKTC